MGLGLRRRQPGTSPRLEPTGLRRAGGLGLLLLVGCLSGARVEVPEVSGATSVLVVQRLDGADAVGVFLRPGESPALFDDGPVWVFALDGSVEGLVPYGAAFAPRAVDRGQPLPPILAAFRAESPGAPFEPATASEDALTAFRLPLPDPEACLGAGGCLTAGAPTLCKSPCPDPPEILGPDLGTLECPTGWARTDGERDRSLCAPPEVPRERCNDDEWQGAGPGCATLAPCPQAPWPTPPDASGPVFYLDPAASPGGDGSEATPFATLDDLSTVPEGSQVLVAAGALSGDVRALQNGLHIIGLCPGRTVWQTSRPQLVASDLTLSGLRVESATTALQVRFGARLRLVGVDIDAAGPALDAQNADLEGVQVKLRAPLGLRARFARVRLQGVDFRGEQLARAFHAHLDIEDLSAVGIDNGPAEDPAALIELRTASRAALRRAHLEAPLEAAIAAPNPITRLDLTDVHFAGSWSHALVADPTVTPTASAPATLTRVAFSKPVRAIRSSALDIVAEDVVVQEALHVGLDLRQSGVAATHHDIRRLWVRSLGENGVRIGDTRRRDAPGVEVRGRDWVVEFVPRTPADGAVVEIREAATLDLVRADLYGPTGRGLEVKCGNATLEDVVLEHGAPLGMTAHPASRLTMRRTRVRSHDADGLDSQVFGNCPRGPIVLEDVEMIGCDQCPTAIRVPAGDGVFGTHLRISGFGIGVEVARDTTMQLERSSLVGNDIGLVVPSGYDLFDVLRGVHLDNERNVEVR